MMLVKTRTGPSRLHGTGLFAAEPVRAGTVVWRFHLDTDREYTREEVEALPEPERSRILSLVHSYISASSGRYIVNLDDGKFFNHSSRSNVVDSDVEECCVAVRDIAEGEELTIDYRKFPEEDPLNFSVVEQG
jgi:SET domain-containing protein